PILLSTLTHVIFQISFFHKSHTTAIYTLSLHDALPISKNWKDVGGPNHAVILYGRENNSGTYGYFKEHVRPRVVLPSVEDDRVIDRKSTRLNSSHRTISYAVFCLKKKKKNNVR